MTRRYSAQDRNWSDNRALIASSRHAGHARPGSNRQQVELSNGRKRKPVRPNARSRPSATLRLRPSAPRPKAQNVNARCKPNKRRPGTPVTPPANRDRSAGKFAAADRQLASAHFAGNGEFKSAAAQSTKAESVYSAIMADAPLIRNQAARLARSSVNAALPTRIASDIVSRNSDCRTACSSWPRKFPIATIWADALCF